MTVEASTSASVSCAPAVWRGDAVSPQRSRLLQVVHGDLALRCCWRSLRSPCSRLHRAAKPYDLLQLDVMKAPAAGSHH